MASLATPFCTALVMAMRNLQTRIADAIPQWEKEWRTHRLPKRARFGIAAGVVYGLHEPNGTFFEGAAADYVGYCVNLAVRLQDHCREAGFLVHETVHPTLPGLIRLDAVGMKGVQIEPVLAFEADLNGLNENYFKTKFRRIAAK